jgi:SAM-dependent methyltransferase
VPDEPSDWLRENLDVIPPERQVLDVACGRGRHALFLAAAGWPVHAVDRDVTALTMLAEQARASGLMVTTEVCDLEAGVPTLGSARYGAVLVFNYLHRPLMPAIVAAVAPRGVLLYETFTIGQAARGHPRNPAFLLTSGELPNLVAPLEVLRAREGEYGGRLVASIVARHR